MFAQGKGKLCNVAGGYKIYAEENSRELKGIKEEIDRLTKEEELYIKRQSQLKREIEIYQRDRDEYLAKQKEQESLLQKLASDERVYKRKFNAIISSKSIFRESLRGSREGRGSKGIGSTGVGRKVKGNFSFLPGKGALKLSWLKRVKKGVPPLEGQEF